VRSRSIPADDRERGSAVVDFVMVSILIVTLLLAVLQVAVYVHVRNVVTASAQAGARYAADADVDSGLGAARTVEVVARATSNQTAHGLACTSAEEADPSGLTLVVVRCTGAVPALLASLGNLLPLEVTGRAVKEGV
jgi:Flp pilus assembly protein TadG